MKMLDHKTKIFPKSRIGTIDVCEVGRKKHHVVAMLEIDVTKSREKIRDYKRNVGRISFNAWLIKVISNAINTNSSIAGFRKGKRKIIIFNDINVSFLIEKEFDGRRIPLPVLIEKANTQDIESITKLLNDAKDEVTNEDQLVLKKRASLSEKLYYYFPAFIRRYIWEFMLKHPKILFPKMGNVAITSLGMYGRINGWFIPISIHPICFGIGSIIKKPIVLNDEIQIREMMNMTVLIDHDVIDGAIAARFLNILIKDIENGMFL